MTRLNRQTIYYAVIAAGVVIFIELMLYLLSAVSPAVGDLLYPGSTPRAAISPTVPDDRLGHRPSPHYPEHDARGFRNPTAYDRADIVALGDSQTYGTSVKARDAWPRRLESTADKRVYSMAYGGYGPVHSLILWDEALALQPKIVIEAFYAGNDLYDSYQAVYKRGQLPELKDPSPALLASLELADRSDPMDKKVAGLMDMIFGKLKDPGREVAADVRSDASRAAPDEVSWPRKALSQHSRIYALLRATWRTLKDLGSEESALDKDIVLQDIPARVKMYPGYLVAVDKGRQKTVLTPEYRRAVIDLDDPRNAEGHRIALKSMERMNELARSRQVRFLAVLIPTKEFAFQEFVEDPGSHYRRLIEAERKMWDRTRQFLDQHGIEYVDAQPALQRQLATGEQPYFDSTDGHPNEVGHAAIADAIKQVLDRRHLASSPPG